MKYANSLSAQAMARVIYVLMGMASYVIMARALGPEALGSYAYAINLVTIACALIDLSATGILARDLVAHGAHRAAYLANFIALRCALGLVVSACAAIATLILVPDDIQHVLLICCPLLALISARFFDPIFQVGGRAWLSLWLTGGYGVYLLISVAIITQVAEEPVGWLILSYALSGAAYGGIGLWLTQGLLQPAYRSVTRAGMWDVAVSIGPFGVSGLFSMLAVRLDLFLIAAIGGIAMVGQFNASFRFVELGIAVIITVLTPLLAVFAHLSKTNRSALYGAFHAMQHFILTWTLAVAVLTPTLSPTVILILYGPEFAPAAAVLDLLAWKFHINFMSLLLFALMMTVGSITFAWWNALLALVLNLLLNYLLIPVLGIKGAGVAAVLSEISQASVTVWFLYRAIGPVFIPRWLPRVLGPAIASAIVVHLPVAVDPLWLAVPAAAVFLIGLFVTGGLPGNPLKAIASAEAAGHQHGDAIQASPAT